MRRVPSGSPRSRGLRVAGAWWTLCRGGRLVQHWVAAVLRCVAPRQSQLHQVRRDPAPGWARVSGARTSQVAVHQPADRRVDGAGCGPLMFAAGALLCSLY
jgi:hypothetical protein